MKSSIPDEIVRQAAEIIPELEHLTQTNPVRFSLVYNQYRMKPQLSLLVGPPSFEDSPADYAQAGAIGSQLHQAHLRNSTGETHWYISMGSFSTHPSAWFDRFTEEPTRFPLANAAAGADLISPILYGESLIKELQHLAQAHFYQQTDDIVRFWKDAAKQRDKERTQHLRKLHRKEVARLKERSKLLNRLELGEIKQLLWYVRAELAGPTPPACIVAIDGSGRPLGKALEWFLGKNRPPVYYLNPKLLRRTKFEDSKQVAVLTEVFARELPEVYALLRASPRSVLFCDDQTGYGNTARALTTFIERLSGQKNGFRLAILSEWNPTNHPSWLQNRQIQGLFVPARQNTLLSVERPTKQSTAFYRRLKWHVMRWRNTPDPPTG